MKQTILIITSLSLCLCLASCTSGHTEPDITKKTEPVSVVTKIQFEDNTVDYSDDESFRKFKSGDKATVQKSSDGYSFSKWEISSVPITRDTIIWSPYLKTFPKSSIYAGHTYREERFYRKVVIVKN